jgi:hypothetical protein
MFQRLPLSPASADNVMSEAAVHCINTEGVFRAQCPIPRMDHLGEQ